MTSNFELCLYLSTKYQYHFSYPIDSNAQDDKLRDALGLSDEDFLEWKPDWQVLPLFNRTDFLKALSNDFSYISESHACREVALNKGAFYVDWQVGMNVLFRSSYITFGYPEQIPEPFKEIVTSALLDPYAVNKPGSSITCNLDDGKFSIGMQPGYWNKAWLSLLTYFAKYGDFMWESSGRDYSDKFSLDETVRAILDSWSGQVGFYSAFGLWLWANKNDGAINANYSQFNGIHNAMDHYTALYEPDSLLEFIAEYKLDLHRVSRLFLNLHKERCKSVGLFIPNWYEVGQDNDGSLAESPEWNDYMGYDDEDMDEDFDDGMGDYDDYPEDWDFEEVW